MTSLVEREQQLNDLERAAQDSAGAIVFLSGEAGAGKTSLVKALRDRLDHRHRFRLGRCEPLATPIPLGPLYEMLPELSNEAGSLLAEGGHRGDLFRSVVEEVTSERSVFVIEDVHFADEATVDLLRYLGRRIADSPTLLVCTYRPEEVGRDHTLRALVGEFGAEARRIELKPLSVQGVASLARGTDVDPLEVFSATGGNPLFVVEMLAHPDESLPATVSDTVLARAHTLPPSAWDVLDVVALTPTGLPLSVVEAMGEQWAIDLDRGVAIGLIEVDADRIRCRHDLIRLALETNVPPARRLLLHRRMFNVLVEQVATAADAVALAHHAVCAHMAEEAVQWSLVAARRSAEDGAHREAVAHYTNALRFREALDADAVVDTTAALSYECYLTGELERAADLGRAVFEMARDTSERGRALRWMSRLAWFRGLRPEAIERGLAAISVLRQAEDADPHELALAYSNMAQLAMLDADREMTAQWAEKALEIARPAQDVEVIVHALNNVGTATKDPSSWRHLEESLRLSIENDLPEHTARAYTNLAYELTWSLDLDRAGEVLAAGMDYTEARDLGTWWWYMRGNRSRLRLLQGRLDDARTDVKAVLDVQTGLLMRHDALVTRARLAMRTGDGSAGDHVVEAIETAREIDEYTRLVHAASVAAEWCWTSGATPVGYEGLIMDSLAAAAARSDAWAATAIGFWQCRRGVGLEHAGLPPMMSRDLSGDLAAAAEEWQHRGAVFHAAVLESLLGDQESMRSGTAMLTALGAEGTLEALRRDLRSRGVVRIPRGPNKSSRSNPAGLTDRQMEVLRCMAVGMSNAEIADELFISQKTAEHHVSAVLSKLGARSRAEAVSHARTGGVLDA